MIDTIKKSDASLAEALKESNAALTTFGENLCKSIEVLAKSMAGSSSQNSQSGYNPYLMDYAPGRSNFTGQYCSAQSRNMSFASPDTPNRANENNFYQEYPVNNYGGSRDTAGQEQEQYGENSLTPL